MSLILAEPKKSLRGAAACADAWLTSRRFALVLAMAIFAAYPDVVLGMRTFFFRDFGYFGYPLAHYHRQNFWHGEIPLWNPLNNCGLPFLAQWNTLVLYPGSLFYLVFPLSWSLGVFCLLHQFLGGLGMYFLAARWTENRFAASVAGLVFAQNGLALNCLMWPNNIAALGWMPWVVLQIERAWEEGGGRLPAAIVTGAMQMLAGAPEIILFTWTILLFTLAARALRAGPERGRLLGRFLAVVLLVGGLAAAQLLPFFELLSHSQRDSGYGHSSWSMPGTGWANFLAPLFHCFSSDANHGVFFQYDQWWTSSYYLGVGPLVLGVLATGQVRQRRVWLLAVLAALSLVLALGDNGYLYRWLRHAAPQFGLLRYPIKFVVIAIFCVPLLAAFAIARFQGRAGTQVAADRRAVCLAWAGTLAVMAAILWFDWRFPIQLDEWPALCRNTSERAAFFTVFLGFLLAVRQATSQKLSCLLQIAVLVVTCLDFLTHAPRQNPTLQGAVFQPGLSRLSPRPAHGVSRAMISPAADLQFRLTATTNASAHYLGNRLGLFSNCNLLDNIPKLNGFFSLYLREADQIWALLYLSGNTNLSRLLDFLNVSHLTAPGTLFDWETRTNFLPFVTAGQRPVFMDDATALGSIAAPDFDPREVVYLPTNARSSVTAGQTVAQILSSPFTAQRGEIDVEAQDRSLLVISQAHYPAWRAVLNGKPTTLWRANYAFQALEVPKGLNHVRIIYHDRFFRLGVVLSAAALAGSALLTRGSVWARSWK